MEYERTYRARGVALLAVPMETTLKRAKVWKDEYHAEMPLLFDPKHRLSDALALSRIPYHVEIDRRGQVVGVVEGEDDAALRALLERLASIDP